MSVVVRVRTLYLCHNSRAVYLFAPAVRACAPTRNPNRPRGVVAPVERYTSGRPNGRGAQHRWDVTLRLERVALAKIVTGRITCCSRRSSFCARYRFLVGRRHGAVQNGAARIAAGKFGRRAAVPRARTAQLGRPVSVSNAPRDVVESVAQRFGF